MLNIVWKWGLSQNGFHKSIILINWIRRWDD
jgi:hypothetical protein